MRTRRAAVLVVCSCLGLGAAALPAGNGRTPSLQPDELRRWLSYLASDQLEGRATFSEGLGLAAAYLAEQLRSFGVKPGGDDGSYFQRVRVLGVKSVNRSTLTVTVNGRSRTFKDGAGLSFPRNVGGKRRLELDQVEFLGYGLDAPAAAHADYAGKDVKGKAVVWLGARGPEAVDGSEYRRLLGGRHRYATDQMRAAASLGPELPRFGRPRQAEEAAVEAEPSNPQPASPPATPAASPVPEAPAGFGREPLPPADFTTVQRLDKPLPPAVTAKDELFEFLFDAAPVRYAELKEKAEKRAPLPSFTLTGVKLVFELDADYSVVRTQLTRNVVGVVEGGDPVLSSSYVALGAHYDHVGYAEGELGPGAEGEQRRLGAPGRVKQGALEDRIWNGADDDGSGSATLLGIAKAAAAGQRPRRSLLFVWHSGEERGLYGSRFLVDQPQPSADTIVAQLNMDMVGRNRDDKPEQENTVYLVGSDRISSELHNLSEQANASLPRPLELSYEMNDPADPEQVYFRSDHASYAAAGIPVIFYTTGLHADYHFNSDSVEKIRFEKMARIGQLVLATALRVADLEQPPARDNKGPRVGRGHSGPLLP